MRKIAVALSKGGVGKTTTSVSLSAGLALKGYRALLIDTDTQGQSAEALGVQPETGLAEVASGDADIQDALFLARDNLWLLAGGREMAGLKRLIARQDYGGERLLAKALGPLDGLFDYVILDTAPGWDSLSVNVLFYAEEILAPVSLESLTIRGLMAFIERLTDLKEYRPGLQLRYILPTFLDQRVKKSEEIMGQLKAYFGQQLCQPIRYNVRLSEAPGLGKTIFEYAPKSPGAKDYAILTERIAADE